MCTLNSARSLSTLDLAAVKADTRLGHAVRLIDEEHTRILLALRDRSAAASEQIAQRAREQLGTPTASTVDQVAAGFHAILTHNRYRQGPAGTPPSPTWLARSTGSSATAGPSR
jgi:hypothetical protein